jgi:hypothetical protein
VQTLPTLLTDGSNYELRYVDSRDRTVGVAAAADRSAFKVVIVSGDHITTVLRDLPTDRGPVFDGFVRYEGSIYWTEATVRDDGTDLTQLWASPLDKPAAHLVVADMGYAQLDSSAYNVIVANGTISWVAVSGANVQGTIVRSVPVGGGPVTERSWPGSWRQLARPWLASVGAASTILLNQDTGAQVTVPGSDVASTNCGAAWCRMTVVNAGVPVRLDLVAPDGGQRTRIAGPNTSFDTVDVAPLGRFELMTQTGNGLPTGQVNILLYDHQAASTTLVETSSQTLINVRDGWAWWLSGDFSAPAWHLLDLTSLTR